MRHFDFLKWLWLAGLLYTFWKGYVFYQQGSVEQAVGYAMLCSVCIMLFLRHLTDFYYLHMKMKKIDRLSGSAFEKYLEVQFRYLGYHVRRTSQSHDYGADLILKKHRKKIVVQAKRYAKNVGIAAVQEAVGSIAYYGADEAMVVTNSGFTKNAKILARQNAVTLWDRREIQKKFHIKG